MGWAWGATSAGLPVELTLAQWKNLRDPDTPAITFTDGIRFLKEHGDWPDSKTIRLRTETAALTEQPDAATMKQFCEESPPISGRGMFACLDARAGTPEQQKHWLHQGWEQGDFSASEEHLILHSHMDQLSLADHRARLERLLYEHKTVPAKRLLDMLPALHRQHHTAWIAMIQHDKKAKAKLNALSATERQHFGILFERLSTAIEAKHFDNAVILAHQVPATAPYPELWWPMRNIAIREALAKRNYATALDILSRRGELKGEMLAEALWLKGWITLSFKHNAQAAYKEFRELYTQVSTPVSRARAAFWAARAATENGNADIARDWYEKAAQNPTVFYGQLAHIELHRDTPLSFPAMPAPSREQAQAFEKEEIVQAARLLNAEPDTSLRDKFLNHLAHTADTPERMTMVATLANDLGGISRAVKAAKLGLRQKVVLMQPGWPRIELPEQLGVEPALALAISRQESEFDPNARSQANAQGLMQLLPATARHIAKQNDMAYADASLTNPTENLKLGSAYLGRIIEGFDGSYVLGIASYNAGPSTIRHWIEMMGNPPKTLTGMLNWIEAIPYGETRNYVMRVLENLTIYRTLADPKAPPALVNDLLR